MNAIIYHIYSSVSELMNFKYMCINVSIQTVGAPALANGLHRHTNLTYICYSADCTQTIAVSERFKDLHLHSAFQVNQFFKVLDTFTHSHTHSSRGVRMFSWIAFKCVYYSCLCSHWLLCQINTPVTNAISATYFVLMYLWFELSSLRFFEWFNLQ